MSNSRQFNLGPGRSTGGCHWLRSRSVAVWWEFAFGFGVALGVINVKPYSRDCVLNILNGGCSGIIHYGDRPVGEIWRCAQDPVVCLIEQMEKLLTAFGTAKLRNRERHISVVVTKAHSVARAETDCRDHQKYGVSCRISHMICDHSSWRKVL